MIRAQHLILPAVLLATITLHAGDEADVAARYEKQIADLRQQVAKVTLELRAAQRELEAIRDFLAERQLKATFERWKTLRADLAEQRRRLKRERVRLEAARDALDRTTRRIAEEQARAQDRAEQRAEKATAPNWSAQYQMGVIYEDGDELFVKTTDGSVFIDGDNDIDHRNILVRGTFLNKAAAPWRYTFEIRAGGAERFTGSRRIIGSWRYQTPLLDPGELHEFEVKMPVDHVSRVRVIQIGNVVADRPGRAADHDPQPVQRTEQRRGETVEAPNAY